MTAPSALVVSRLMLRVALILNVIFGTVLGGMMVLSLAFGGLFVAFEGFGELAPLDGLILAIVTVSSVAVFRLTHLILKYLIEILDTVSAGEPFAEANAQRLRGVAWKLLAVEALSLLGQLLMDRLDLKFPIDIETPLTVSVGMLVAVPLLLVLARVFEEGTRMRAATQAPAGA